MPTAATASLVIRGAGSTIDVGAFGGTLVGVSVEGGTMGLIDFYDRSDGAVSGTAIWAFTPAAGTAGTFFQFGDGTEGGAISNGLVVRRGAATDVVVFYKVLRVNP